MDAYVRNASDKQQVKKAKQKEAFGRDSEIEQMREVLSTVSGRKVIWRYLEKCGVFRFGFEENERYDTFLSGQRNIGGMILSDIQDVDPSLFGDLSKEMKQQREKDNG